MTTQTAADEFTASIQRSQIRREFADWWFALKPHMSCLRPTDDDWVEFIRQRDVEGRATCQ
jgi:hypothetical protein